MLRTSHDAAFGAAKGRHAGRQGVECMESAVKRPAGVTIVAVLAFATGAVYLLDGLRILGFVVFGPAQALSNVSMSGWSLLFVGALWVTLGIGFLMLKGWAWIAGVITVGISFIVAFFANLNGAQIGELFMATILPLVVLFYLDSTKVKAAFGLEE
jgi:hypothetical protein